VVGVQFVTAPILRLEHVEDGVEAGDFVLHDGGAEDRGQRLVAEVFNVPSRGDDEATAAGNSLGEPDSSKVDAIGETQCDDEAGAVRALGTERVCLVNDQRRSMALTDLYQLGKGGDVAIGAVERVDTDEPRPALG